ncbi:MAG: hypothetical protein MRY74_00260 [Neomegalonema sp.]|nr:hypothetical protein [Neomegalonema sp.]
MPGNPPDYLFATDAIGRFATMSAVLALLWYGAGNVRTDRSAVARLALTASAVLVLWFAVAYWLGAANFFWAGANPLAPTIALAIIAPTILGAWLFLRSSAAGPLIDAIPLSWFVAAQFYRVIGGVFIWLWIDGRLPWQFAAPAGIGDVLTGVLAVWLVIQGPVTRKAARAWNWFGALDLVIAVTMGAITSPGAAQLLAFDTPNLLISAYPLVLIPTFIVPLSIILHVLCLWKLRRMAAHGPSEVAIQAA